MPVTVPVSELVSLSASAPVFVSVPVPVPVPVPVLVPVPMYVSVLDNPSGPSASSAIQAYMLQSNMLGQVVSTRQACIST